MKENEELEPIKVYLNTDQIEHIREVFNNSEDRTLGYGNVVSLIDQYVRANGTADEEYELLFNLLKAVNAVVPKLDDYAETIQATFPLVSSVAFYDLVILIGIVAPNDLNDLFGRVFSNKPKPPTPKA